MKAAMERLRILHITSESGWRGGENQLSLLMRQQRGAGHSAALAAPPGSMIAEKAMQQGSKVFSLKQRSDLDLFAAWGLSHIIQTYECDLLHAHSGRAHAIAALAKRLGKQILPLVVSRRVAFPLKKRPWNCLKYRTADHFIAISNAAASPLQQLGVNNQAITIVPDGIDTERFEESREPNVRKEFGISDDVFVIGNIAHCESNKNQSFILDAAPSVLNAHPQTKFIIIGDGPELENLRRQANALGIQDQMIFTGFRKDIERFYRSFNCFVMTSLEEGLCSSILEAQCCGVPVVAMKSGGIPEIIVHNQSGLLFPQNDNQAFIAAIDKYIQDNSFAQTIGQAGRQSVLENFTIASVAERTLDVYRKVIRRM